MKIAIILSCMLVLAFGSVIAYDERSEFNWKHHGTNFLSDNMEIELDDGTVIITRHSFHSDVIEITEDYELYINDRHIETNEKQKDLLGKFYTQSVILVEEAEEVGLKGAKIGAKGARLGVKAVGGVLRLLSTEYDVEDLEEEMELQAEELEKEADALEEQAEELEDIADELEELADEMVQNIPELEELDW